VITRRTLLIFQFGGCLVFILSGLVSTYTITTLMPSVGKGVIQGLEASSRQALVEEEDVEQVRNKGLYYFDLAEGLKQAQASEELSILETVRHFCYLLAAVFGLGGLLGGAARLQPAPPAKIAAHASVPVERA
jgi:hypothetical protein